MGHDLQLFVEPPNGIQAQHPLFIAGDVITGKVVLTLQGDENIETISLELRGECKCRFIKYQAGNTQSHRYDLVFLTSTQTLFQGPFKMRASTYSYPFSFPIPSTLNYTPSKFEDQTFAPEYNFAGPKPLPPTLPPYAGNDAWFEITYQLIARVPCTLHDWTSTHPLTISPPRTVPSPPPAFQQADYQPPSVSTHRLHYRLSPSDGTPRKLTTKESLKESFHHSTDTHTLDYNLSAVAPTAIVIGQSYPISLTLSYSVPSPSASTPGTKTGGGEPLPAFILKSTTLLLTPRTSMRVPGRLITDNTHESHSTFSISSSSLSSLNIRLKNGEEVKLEDCFPKEESYAPPSFESWALKRAYALELKCVVEVLGEERECGFKWGRVVLFAARMGGDGEEGEGELPRYEAEGEEGVKRVEVGVSEYK